MSQRPDLHVAIEDRIATLTIDNPKVNALSSAVLDQLEAALDECLAADEVKVIIIIGAGRTAFAGGADVKQLAAFAVAGDRAGARAFILRGQSLFDKIEAAPKPVIAAVNGVALGGGLELALACHIRIVAEHARLAAAESNLGVVPGWGASRRLALLVGTGRALEWILTGDPIGADEALRTGLANRVVPPEQLAAASIELAGKLAAKSRLTNASAIRQVVYGSKLAPAAAMAFEAEQFVGLIGSHDAAEGLTAFLEKRPAKFADC